MPSAAPALNPEATTDIPFDWREQHHFTRIKIAKKLFPDMAEDVTSAAIADEMIAGYLGE